MPRGGPLSLADGHDLLPRGTIEVAPARELAGIRSVDAVYDRDGNLAVESLKRPMLAFGHGQVPTTLPREEVAEVHDEPVVWGGDLLNQFGHFMVESVARLWPLLPDGELEGLSVVFRQPRDASFAREWLEGFGAQTLYLPDRGTARFTRMFVPEQSWRLGAWIAPEFRDIHLHARRGLDTPAAPNHDVLWLSRSQLGPERVAYDEALLEWILRDHLTPVHLETMTLAEQVGTLEGCRAVAGVMGSAFHALLPTADVPDCLYLCPSFAKGPYTAQHLVLDGTATFLQALQPAAKLRRLRREGFLFPGGHRILIPETLDALHSTVLPSLLDDPRIAAFASPRKAFRHAPPVSEIDRAIIEVLGDPFSAELRTRLGRLFAERDLDRQAEEQSAFAADLAY